MKKLLMLFLGTITLFAYTGFLQPKPGAWAKYEVKTEEGWIPLTTKYLGTTTYKGKKVNIIETETLVNGQKMVTQQWSAVDDDSMIQKSITLTPMGIMCMEQEFYQEGGAPQTHIKTPKEFSPKRPDIRYGNYTLPNGKKLKVAIFKTEDGEVWVSSKVPFGIVKVVANGKTTLRLVDYGLSGAKASIPLKEAKACTPMKLPFPMM